MAKTKTVEEVVETTPDVSVAVKALLMKKAKDIFEREPQNAFVPKNLDALVAEIINIIK